MKSQVTIRYLYLLSGFNYSKEMDLMKNPLHILNTVVENHQLLKNKLFIK